VVAGAAFAAGLVWVVWQGGILIGESAAFLWRQVTLVSEMTQTAVGKLGRDVASRFGRADTGKSHPSDSALLRKRIEPNSLPYPETGRVPLADGIRRVDYALVQAVQRLGLRTSRLELLQGTMVEEGARSGAAPYLFQRIRVRVSGTARDFAASVSAALRVRAEGSAVSLEVRHARQVLKIRVGKILTHEIFILPAVKKVASPPSKPVSRLTIVIDALESSPEDIRPLLALNLPFAISVLPDSPHAGEIAKAVTASGREVLLHQPMEAIKGKSSDPGPGAIKLSMSAAELRAQLHKNFARVPEAVGMSNYMGSGVTSDRKACLAIAAEAASCGLFVLDSVTIPSSELYASARSHGLASWRNGMFIDHQSPPAAEILKNLRRAENRARQVGHFVTIGSFGPETLKALEEWSRSRDTSVAVVPLRHQPY